MKMGLLQCSCGYAGDEAGFADHLGEVFIPLHDDIGTDGRAHAELAVDCAPAAEGDPGPSDVPAGACLCGFASEDATELDDHLLAVFITADGVGTDGGRHEPDCLSVPATGG